MSPIRLYFTEFLPAAVHQIGVFCGEVLTNGFNEPDNRPVYFSHFLPYTRFEDGVDLSNGDVYWNDDPRVTRLKCLLLAAGTPIVHAISLVLNLANRIVKIISFAHFWYPLPENYSLSKRSWSFGKDLLRVAFSPIIYIGLELSAIYGLFLPDNGRKLYATFERCAYGKELLAPCFQPNATCHLGGGVPGKKNEW